MSPSLDCFKCGKKFKQQGWLYQHQSHCDGFTMCKCGCGALSLTDYCAGHNRRGEKQSTVEKLKRSESLKNYYNQVAPEVLIEKGKKISKTKLSEEGNKTAKLARQKCAKQLSTLMKGRRPPNKILDSDKTLFNCLHCGKAMLLVPCFVGKKKFCNRKCSTDYKKGCPMKNWNPNSHHDKSGYGISGLYKRVLFRSSLELSFLIKAFEIGDDVIAEPVRIKIWDYLSEIDRDGFYNIKRHQYYSPDYLVNNDIYVELKPDRFVQPEWEGFYEIMIKLKALENFAKSGGKKVALITDEMMGENVLSYKQIKDLSKLDVLFFKEKDRDRFQGAKRSST